MQHLGLQSIQEIVDTRIALAGWRIQMRPEVEADPPDRLVSVFPIMLGGCCEMRASLIGHADEPDEELLISVGQCRNVNELAVQIDRVDIVVLILLILFVEQLVGV